MKVNSKGVLLVGTGVVFIVFAIMFASCRSNRKLVEVFDNGPVGGKQGPSEGMIWVGNDDSPPPGKSWKTIDPATLTEDQKKQIR